MRTMVDVTPNLLFIFVGIVSLTMAYKNIFSNKFISFHQQAAGKQWDDIDKGVRFVIIALMRVSGLGFLAVALLLLIYPVIKYYENNSLFLSVIPVISLLYCLGLFLFNYQLYVQTGTKTPWKRSLGAAIIIGAGLIVSML